MKRSQSAERNVPSLVQNSTNCVWSPLLVTISTGSIGRPDSQLDEASPSFSLFVKVPSLYYPPIYASSQVLSSLILIFFDKNCMCKLHLCQAEMCALASHIVLFNHPNVGWRIEIIVERRVACY